MSIAQLIPLLLNASMGVVVVALGLHASLRDAAYLLRKPGLLIRSILSMNIIMPALAMIVVGLLSLHPAIEIAIVALALSPVPPILPSTQTRAGGHSAYIISLLVIAAVLALVTVPVGLAIGASIFGRGERAPPVAIAAVLALTIVIPLVLGMTIRHFWPELARVSIRPVTLIGYVLLLVAVVPTLFAIWGLILSMIGNGTLLTLAIFTIAGVTLGHLLGGPDPDDRTVLALATGTRHPGVALAIASATFPEQHQVLAVVVLHLIVGAVVSGPYSSWRRRVHARLAPHVSQ